MTRPARLLLIPLLALACMHAPPPVEEKKEEPPKPKPVVHKAPPAPAVGEPVTTAGNEKAAPGRPELSATPAGLMKPGGVEKIQEALRAKGVLTEAPNGNLDGPTQTAIKKFQESEQLARTGAPDRETLRHLGLKPKEIYKDAER